MPILSRHQPGPARISVGSAAQEAPAVSEPRNASDVFRRFFALISRFERPPGGLETKSVASRAARITRLDDETIRKP